MDKITWGLVAALGAAVVTPAAASAPANDGILAPISVAELLEPVADPVATLNALSGRQLEAVEASDGDMATIHRHHYFSVLPRPVHHRQHH